MTTKTSTRGRKTTKKATAVSPSSPEKSQGGGSTTFKVGDKVKVVDNLFPHMERFIGREGKVTGSVTNYSCMVTLKGSLKRWFDFRELEKL